MRLAGARVQGAQGFEFNRRRRKRLDRAATLSGQPLRAGFVDGRAVEERRQCSSSLRVRLQHAKSVITNCGPVPRIVVLARAPLPARKPALVRKSSCATRLRGVALSITNVCRAWAAISVAPPAPGNRVLGASYGPITVLFRLPCLSTCAAPRKPTSTRPACSR
jgi:hypothetical protein